MPESVLQPVLRSETAWYALRVRSNFERTASTSLNQRGIEEFTPFYQAKRRWSDRVKVIDFPLFPGYVFCRFDYMNRLPVLQTPGVVSVVGFGSGPAPVDPLEIAHLQSVVRANNPAFPWPYLRTGQKVRVRTGPLRGLEGLLLDLKDGRRIVVSVTLLQRSVAAQIDREDVEPIL